ncbi:sulfite exporter TauE/SafE family protein [Teredinibacter turnerae]|uniref:sulfite exporter TauE/SafE family protein n=1 Tax=Teredinibacter turnerae TaxID=2426 RepID=UPI00037CCF08|nr:sulfite exporter TauE/SafE family protein [Teredinibacter turnerae]
MNTCIQRRNISDAVDYRPARMGFVAAVLDSPGSFNIVNELLEYSFVCACSGIVAGFVAGLFGVGGGIVIVPALYFVFGALGMEPSHALAMAVATSLGTILPTSISSLRAHHRLGNIEWHVVRLAVPSLVLGACAGALLVSFFAGEWLSLVFGSTLLVVAWLVLRKGIGATGAVASAKLTPVVLRLAVFFLAVISALAGVGGGALGSPLLVMGGYSVHRAVGTAASFGAFIALPSIILIALFSVTPEGAPPYSLGLISLPAWALISVCTYLVAPFGAKFGKQLSARHLATVLAAFLMIIGVKMLYTGIAYYLALA